MAEAEKKRRERGRGGEEKEASRRKSLKKAAYVAPTLVVLGQLVRPKKASADDFGPPPSDPDGWSEERTFGEKFVESGQKENR